MASCPTGFAIAADGRCIPIPIGDAATPIGDAMAPDGGNDTGVDAGPMPDTGTPAPDAWVAPPIDAGTAPDGCVLATFYRDADGDGHGDPAMPTFSCGAAPSGYVASNDDCDDACESCHPGGVEICEGSLDQNCTGGVDDGCECTNGATETCGTSSVAPCTLGMRRCDSGRWSSCSDHVEPAMEVCDGTDNDCDGTIDDGVPMATFYVDGDGDGYGTGAAMMACMAPAGSASTAGDCDDTTAARRPGLAEVCNGVDDNCTGAADDGPGLACVRGAATTCLTTCRTMGTGLCTDTCALPTGPACSPPGETCDGTDQDCDGLADENLVSTTGAPLTALAAGTTAATTFGGTHLLPTTTGYVLFAQTRESPSHVVMQSLGTDGTPVGARIPVDSSVAPPADAPWSVRAAGSDFVIAWGYVGSSTTGTITIARINATGNRLTSRTLSLGSWSGHNRVVITAADATNVTLYAAVHSVATPSMYGILRFRLSWDGAAYNQVASDALTTTLGSAGVFDAVATPFSDYVVYLDASGTTRLAGMRVGDTTGTAIGPIAAAIGSPVGLAIGISNAGSPVATDNALGIAWMDLVGSTGATTHFIEVRGTSPFAVGPATALPGGTGGSQTQRPHLLDVVAVPNAMMAGSTARAGHWIVAGGELTGLTFVERVWEITVAPTPIAMMHTVPTSSGALGDLSIAIDATGRIRLAHATTAHAAVTRQLGCR